MGIGERFGFEKTDRIEPEIQARQLSREIPNFVNAASLVCMRAYHDCLEAFLRSLGVTEQDAGEYEIRTASPGAGVPAEVWHKDLKVGEISYLFVVNNGYRFVIECTPLLLSAQKGPK